MTADKVGQSGVLFVITIAWPFDALVAADFIQLPAQRFDFSL